MNDVTLDYLMNKVDSRRARRRGDSRRYSDSSEHDYRDSRGRATFEGEMDFRDSEEHPDTRYDSRDYRRDSRDSRDYRDSRNSRDYRDYHNVPRLTKSDMHRWKQMMENEDGTQGAHYDMQQTMAAADKLGIHFDEFDEKEFCVAVNMMYSDYCKVAKKYVAPDKELHFFAELAKAFLEDEDAPEGSEKLALYYHCIVDA